ncbi:hypothetical protein CAPTEDRAFT_190756 [Capitella teleta]|uniref:Peptidase M14 domain-containing protein n=1 Tax=Capitella teleta TaxID=283909 RepID=R7TWP1_CAPTE|nr:hypothetical protein CAPTEDRAFT_190756 [Capitella teleta]|eukprot:ELT95841.1 hypothetical protein CAPTEDRAFT_190756 [Capitella teleta]
MGAEIQRQSIQASPKRGIWIDAGIHAREWLAPATAMHLIHTFAVAIRRNDRQLLSMLDDYDWYFMPCINPDGYEYSRNHDRLWRKTRSRHHGNQECIGVDSNRNWDFHWMEIGASFDPCSSIYAGPYAFSEPETRAVRDFLLTYRSTLVAYISFHSYGQFLLHPWGYTSDLPEDHEKLMFVLDHVAAVIQSTTGKQYTRGSSTNVLYEAAGGSDDWAKAVAGIPFSFTFELRDHGLHGFLVPEDEIEESGREMFAALNELQSAISVLRKIQ